MGHQGEAERKEGDGERGVGGGNTEGLKYAWGLALLGARKKKMGKGERMRDIKRRMRESWKQFEEGRELVGVRTRERIRDKIKDGSKVCHKGEGDDTVTCLAKAHGKARINSEWDRTGRACWVGHTGHARPFHSVLLTTYTHVQVSFHLGRSMVKPGHRNRG